MYVHPELNAWLADPPVCSHEGQPGLYGSYSSGEEMVLEMHVYV